VIIKYMLGTCWYYRFWQKSRLFD